jgi:hypothetical protein
LPKIILPKKLVQISGWKLITKKHKRFPREEKLFHYEATKAHEEKIRVFGDSWFKN